MNGSNWLASPLTATAVVLAGLGLLAVPLHRLTSSPATSAPVGKPESHGEILHAILRLKLLSPARSVVVAAGDVAVWKLSDVPAGETEEDVSLPFADGRADLTVQVDFGASNVESAAFLTVMPDGFEGQTHFVLGSGRTADLLRYEWHVH